MQDFTSRFRQALAGLNPRQRLAVDTLEGPVLVFAGPGTGKTQVLTLRVANLIAQGLAEPEQILALTFTNSAAVNMRLRLQSLIGPAASAVNFGTFHEFCQIVIRERPEAFDFGSQAQPLGDLERIDIIQHLIDDLNLRALRPHTSPYHYLEAIIKAINDLKQENITPESYRELMAQERERSFELLESPKAKKPPSKTKINAWKKKLARQEELGLIYEHYLEELRARHRYDFADMILQTVRVFRDQPDILAAYQEKFQYILVDEYQDTNNAQDAVLDLLVAYWDEQANLFVVGDPYQSIYRFQGANLENFLGFTKRYPAATVINLETGYRCHQLTYSLAHALIGEMNQLEADWQPEAALENYQKINGQPALLTACASRESELINIVTRIRSLVDAGTPPEEIAIIYRKNREADLIMHVCEQYGIFYEIEGGDNVLEHDLIVTLINLLTLFDQLTNERRAQTIIYQLLWLPAWQLEPYTVVLLVRYGREHKLNLADMIFRLEAPLFHNLKAYGIKESQLDKISDLSQRLNQLQRQSQTERPSRFLQFLLEKSGILSWVRQQPDKINLLLSLYTFQRQVMTWEQSQKGFGLADLLKNLELMQEHHLRLPLQDLNQSRGAIALTTAHRAKGREWQYVFIYGLNSGVWDHVRAPLHIDLPSGIVSQQIDEKKAAADEEKRLFYVALTRARQQNFISWHETEIVDGQTRAKQPSDLVSWLQAQQETKRTQQVPELLSAEQLNSRLETLLLPPPVRDWDACSREFLASRVSQLTMSVTMLNDYLSDTQLFIERYLLQAPEYAHTRSLVFGTCMHRALEACVRAQIQTGELLPLSATQEVFARELIASDLSGADLQASLEVGKESIQLYYPQLQSNARPLAVERQFGVLPIAIIKCQ